MFQNHKWVIQLTLHPYGPNNRASKHTEEKSDRNAKRNIQIHYSSKRNISRKYPYLENKQYASNSSQGRK